MSPKSQNWNANEVVTKIMLTADYILKCCILFMYNSIITKPQPSHKQSVK